jgi:transposase InsO family protein
VTELERTVAAVNRQVRHRERTCNTVRPHQALGYRTPREFLQDLARAG